MKIGINIPNLANQKLSGVSVYIINLVNAIAKIDEKNKYVFFGKKPKQINENENFSFVDLNDKTILKRLIWDHIKLTRSVEREKVDLLHCPKSSLPKGLKIKSLVTIFDTIFFRFPQYYSFLWKKYWLPTIKKSCSRANKIITISKSTKDDLISFLNINDEKINVIEFGINHDDFNPKKNSEINPTPEGLKIQKPYFLFVGIVHPRKNITTLLKAFQLFKKENKTEHKMVIAGSLGWKGKQILNKIKNEKLDKNVIFLNHIDNKKLPYLYSAAEGFIYPSFYEGFGLPIIESMACGCPVITSNISSMPEIAEKAAIMVSPNKPEEIKDGMNKITSDKSFRNELIKKGMTQAKKFTWEKCAKKTLNLYEEMGGS